MRLNQTFLYLLMGGLFVSGLLGQGLAAAEENLRQPNVVFILADDLGWSDTTLFGTTKFYKTPNVERLAKRGMTFTRAYSSSPLCSPTRASVLTGLSPARHGITSPTCHLPKVVLEPVVSRSAAPNQKATIPESVTRLDTDYYTLAEMFKDNGYATGHFGKWHLGPEPYSPLQHGFDVDVPHFAGPGPAGSYVAPWKFKDFDHDPNIPDEHIEDRMAKEATRFMEQRADAPFFLNYWMFSVHAPFDAKQNLIDQYRKVVDPSDPQRSPTYAAMIESMDDAIGTLLDTIDRLGIADNTIIVFASDNGGNMYNEVDGTTATSNAPLKGGKATMYEGGVRGPAIVIQPGVVKPETHSDAIIQSIDFYPTLLEMLAIAPQPEQSFDGISLVPALQGGKLSREAIFTFFPHSPGIPDWLPPAVSAHQGDWKLIRIFHGGQDGAHRHKLFNLHDDIGERNDLAEKYPDRVQQMDALIQQHLEDANAVCPLANPNFDPAKYDITQEGKASLKGGAKEAKTPHARPAGKPVAGWQPSGTCKLSLVAGGLQVQSDGNDPHFSYQLSEPVVGAKLWLKIRMKSDSAGQGQVFWKSNDAPYAAERSTFFDVYHDGKLHDYEVQISPTGSTQGIRLDPSRSRGTIEILQMQLTTENDELVKQWSFN
ncbi:sulfatase [Rubripirellula reticaptiva]|uniref:Arylsulfatase n=1 Tax=Rubripirellula reticaptiva TaxID=2528013 RepID=A0A5C6EWW7_9BACT|nr:sulfatase [Rubripirellula reticaptiva]TWU51741.1 Arylsulfatase precursor [Rubripirellula reticaptiva]